jgi:hypothetical protein
MSIICQIFFQLTDSERVKSSTDDDGDGKKFAKTKNVLNCCG